MVDLLNISEEELNELWVDDPDILDDLVRDSKLDPIQLAEVFVKHPILQDSILKYSDPIELYNNVYDNQVFDANPADYEHDWEEYKKVQAEYTRALNAIKQYVIRDPYYSETPMADTFRDAPVEVEDWDDPHGTIKRAKNENIERKTILQQKEAELSALETEEKTISEAEVLINQQKEGQDIGEE